MITKLYQQWLQSLRETTAPHPRTCPRPDLFATAVPHHQLQEDQAGQLMGQVLLAVADRKKERPAALALRLLVEGLVLLPKPSEKSWPQCKTLTRLKGRLKLTTILRKKRPLLVVVHQFHGKIPPKIII